MIGEVLAAGSFRDATAWARLLREARTASKPEISPRNWWRAGLGAK
jgi:hypothetical protein